MTTIDDRVAARIKRLVEVGNGDCWLWTARRHRDGYAQIQLDGRTQLAHRVAYRVFVGPIPDGLTLDHLCRVRHCVNPAHLEPVTGRINTLRGNGPSALNAIKKQCSRDHDFTDENTYVDKLGRRDCRTCHRAKDARRRRAARPELLRDATPQLIAAHRARTTANTSGYKGVSFHRARNQWQAYIKVDQRQRYLGLHPTAEDAAHAYDAAALDAWGEFGVCWGRSTATTTPPSHGAR
jgi:hypothetical protein